MLYLKDLVCDCIFWGLQCSLFSVPLVRFDMFALKAQHIVWVQNREYGYLQIALEIYTYFFLHQYRILTANLCGWCIRSLWLALYILLVTCWTWSRSDSLDKFEDSFEIEISILKLKQSIIWWVFSGIDTVHCRGSCALCSENPTPLDIHLIHPIFKKCTSSLIHPAHWFILTFLYLLLPH